MPWIRYEGMSNARESGNTEAKSNEDLLARIAELEAQVAAQGQTIEKLRESQNVQDRSDVEKRSMLAALECCTDFVGIAGLDGRAIFVNEAGRRLVGVPTDTITTDTIMADYVMPDELPRLEKEIIPAILREGHWAGEFRFRHMPTNTAIPVYYSAYLVKHPETGAPMALATVTRDMRSEKLQAAERSRLLAQQLEVTEALRDKQQQMSQLEEERHEMIAAVENSADFIGICTMDGWAVYLNAAGRDLIGFDRDGDIRTLEVAKALAPESNDKFVREVILCDTPPAPPPNVPQLDPAEGESVEDAFERHTADPVCAGCHLTLDPIGHGLERYDSIGRLRQSYADGSPVRMAGEITIDGTKLAFAGGKELGQAVASSEAAARCVVAHAYRFALGREETDDDACSMERLAESYAAADQAFEPLLLEIVTSDAFKIALASASIRLSHQGRYSPNIRMPVSAIGTANTTSGC